MRTVTREERVKEVHAGWNVLRSRVYLFQIRYFLLYCSFKVEIGHDECRWRGSIVQVARAGKRPAGELRS